eukprot:TRINITY_DN2376_c0_g1_i1.p1 TRINITY_DN2376_c0_g1~~TRINITY_DN2376_c0_g1_i1.p1  ORF type:complete len:145 (+),score=29.93 TRINITY_DN2376_c0_g1_i1:83-517(+)
MFVWKGNLVAQPLTRWSSSTSQTLYRGVPVTHPGYHEALKGCVRSGRRVLLKSSAVEKLDHARCHNADELNSLPEEKRRDLTSWTRNKKVAELFAKEGGCVLCATVGPDHGQHLVWSPDDYLEEEVLVEGDVLNATVEVITQKE